MNAENIEDLALIIRVKVLQELLDLKVAETADLKAENGKLKAENGNLKKMLPHVDIPFHG